jgi:SSS family transporter
MSALDWWVLFGALAFFVLYGVWRSRGERDLTDFLLAGRSMPWPMVAVSVMATQASAVTFLSGPGQGFKDGLRFVQFYFGLPLAMVAICALAIPVYTRLRVFTAYEYLESRFDAKTRTLAAALFLVQRGLAAGITIYAPALVLSVLLGWDVRATCALLGGLMVIYTVAGGSKAVSHTQALQFTIILGTMVLAFVLIARALPSGVGLVDAAAVAGQLGHLRALETRFDPNDRYTLWSGLIGGFFLQLSYFGTDQSQVGRYLAARSTAQSRLGLLFNGLVKIPMQLGILTLGVLVFAFYLFTPPPLHFDPQVRAKLRTNHRAAYQLLEDRQFAAWEVRRSAAEDYVAGRRSHDVAQRLFAATGLAIGEDSLAAVERDKEALLRATDPGANPSDVNYVFLSFVLATLPAGIIGLVFAAVFAASMNSSSAEIHALTSTTVVDVIQRVRGSDPGRHGVWVSRAVTLGWAAFAVVIADAASRLGSLIEAVNIVGSLFYGTILGIFLTAFLLRRVGGTAVFAAALVAEAVVIACFKLTAISFLWYNLIGCALVMGLALVFQMFVRDAAGARPAAAR